MSVALFGATGATGLCLVRQLGARGTIVRCLVRNPSKMPADLLNATQLVEGVATDEAAVTECIKGCSSVVVSLGGPAKGPGVDICSKAQALINQAVLSMSPQPLVILVSSIGVGDHYQHCSLFAKFFASYIIPQALADKKIQEDLARSLENWIIVRPGGLVDTPSTGRWTAAHDACTCFPRIPRADVAKFLIEECIEKGKGSPWFNRTPALVA
mmetsp:Transcript_36596/g.97579  ORF Transcript_36596/g.97579 Transcript_36596/m.97579 type:complete len:213 (-) Transcript_36596:165-803(-)